MARFSAIGLMAICLAGALTASAQTVQEAAQTLGLNTLLQALAFSPEASTLVTDPTFKGVIAGPTDAALAAALAAAGAQATNATAITETFKYHVLPNATLTNDEDFPSARGPAYNVSILQSGSNWVFLGTALNRSTTTADCVPFNSGSATLCPIDTVLVPPTATIYSYLSANPDLSVLKAAIDADALLYTVTNGIDAAATVFAPTNDAFAAALQTFNLSADTLIGSKFARTTILGHLGGGVPFKSTDPATTLQTLDDAITLAVDPAAGTVTLNGGPAPSSASITAVDGNAGKSIVHKINGVLLATGNTTELTERVVPPTIAGGKTPAGRSPAPTTTGSPAPVATGSPAPVATGSPAPVATGSPAPVATGSPAPVATGSPAPTTTGSPAPVATGSPAPVTAGSPVINTTAPIPGVITVSPSPAIAGNRSAPAAATALSPSGLLAAALAGVAMLLMAMGSF